MIVENNSLAIDLKDLPSPCFVVDQQMLEHNLSILDSVQRRTGAKILLALKGFAMHSVFPVLNPVLKGVCASSVDEARLGREEFGGEVHTFSPAYDTDTAAQIMAISDHVIFNSINQWQRFREMGQACHRTIKFGLRLNPEHSEVETALYDPCRPGSRLGIRQENLSASNLEGISGFHFHTLCEQDSYALERTLQHIEAKFGAYLPQMEWLNFGGGHHITRSDYDVDHLCSLLTAWKKKYDVDIYLEPGEAVALNAGVFITTVLDIINNGVDIAIMDCSASTHLADVLEMPFRPDIIGAGKADEKAHTYCLGGISCLAGDSIGDYSFDHPLSVGDRLILTDMAHYTMVKTTTFNGVRLPAIALCNHGEVQIIRQFGYEDFKNRLS